MVLAWTPFRYTLTVFHSLAIGSTCFRLIHRAKIRRLWWDDLWAAVALVGDIILLVIYFLPARYAIRAPGVINAPNRVINFIRWMTLMVYTTVVWSARTSVAVTLVRILPAGRHKLVAKIMVGVFVVFWMALAIQKLFICGRIQGVALNCRIPRTTGIIEIVLDFLGDTWLIVPPLIMLSKMKLERSHRRLIMGIFAVGILNTATSIAHVYFIFMHKESLVGVTGHFQATIGLIICNLLVVVTYLYRVYGRTDGGGSAPDTTNSSGVHLSTVRTTTVSLSTTSNFDQHPSHLNSSRGIFTDDKNIELSSLSGNEALSGSDHRDRKTRRDEEGSYAL